MAEAYIHIGTVAQQTGVPEATLRAWERRYGLLTPQRSGGGQRLYTDADVARVRRMRALIESGLRAAQAARVVGGDPLADDGDAARAERVCAELVAAAVRHDDPGVHLAIDESLARFSTLSAIDLVLAPALRRVGDLWEAGEIGVDTEHFVSNVLRGRLTTLGRGWGAGVGPLVVAACAPAEEHDLALLMLAIGLREDGWRVRFLGARTPIADLAHCVRADDPNVVLVSALTAEAAASFPPDGHGLEAPVMVGGPGYGDSPRGVRETVDLLREHALRRR